MDNSRSAARRLAIQTSNNRAIPGFDKPLREDGTLTPVSEYFGCNTFGWDMMKNALPDEDLAVLKAAPRGKKRVTPELADRVAAAVKHWALSKGATHYCHWFQPQTGATAEKHDSFLSFGKDNSPIEKFTGSELMQQEPDASSFPSGGLRSTFEARGYTAWDASSPMFLVETKNGLTLCIPSIFISYSGESLDEKTPLLCSLSSISQYAEEALQLLGEENYGHVVSTCGPEQEYFVVDRSLRDLRPDLVESGRAIIGRVPPKHQQLADHYFGSIKQRVLNFIMECEYELYKLGVPCKTRHNEVAPSQCESAPIFEVANLASDHNQLVMEVTKVVASRHGLVALFHEKPYADINGSGKHLNWSLATEEGVNLLNPGKQPEENIRFLYFLTAVIKAVHDWGGLLRSSVASAGNDYRLGANEAPPAIMSVFLGETLTGIFQSIASEESPKTAAQEIQLDLSKIPVIAKDNTDRNRTSPFAFTGNKFEFRALGASQSISKSITYLNAAVSESLKEMNTALKAKAGNDKATKQDVIEVIKDTYIATKNILFEGDGYSQEWQLEAEKRGLPNLANTPQALSILNDEKTQSMLIDQGIFRSQNELASRYNVLIEQYNLKKIIELECQEDLISSHVLPAAQLQLQTLGQSLDYQDEVMGKASQIQKDFYAKFVGKVDELITKRDELSTLIAKANESNDETNLGHLLAEDGVRIMEEVNTVSNWLELHIDDNLWSLPKYREMLYSLY